MTRTERAQNPAAISKDKHSRSGLTKTELSHKNGDGAHNWGSNKSKGQDEYLGNEDANGEIFQLDEDQFQARNEISSSPTESTSSLDRDRERPQLGNKGQRRMSSYSEEERKEALQFRGDWNKAGVDLAHIARTSYGIAQSPTEISTSPSKVKSGFNFVSFVVKVVLFAKDHNFIVHMSYILMPIAHVYLQLD
ncbi:uncharacterized protein L201_000395 [Kwoniella dendrophila CBS 6074]|uniref:Hyaluronan/mRNA-binding protein domain-containing protein n=1 Tax=Kwoniella dendrophila CBS 6074 TaxID=1295534 RepID=A0AAX4JJA9_9TREE